MKTIQCTNGQFVNGYWTTDGVFDQKQYHEILCKKLAEKRIFNKSIYRDVFKIFNIQCTMDLHPSQYDLLNTYLDSIR